MSSSRPGRRAAEAPGDRPQGHFRRRVVPLRHDARPDGAAHPLANLWDNGEDPVASLRHEMRVRAIGLERFGLDRLRVGAPLSDLPPSQAASALFAPPISTPGGREDSWRRPIHLRREGSRRGPSVVDRRRSSRPRTGTPALNAVLETLDPNALLLPDRLLDLIPPQAFNRPEGTAERFTGRRAWYLTRSPQP